MIRELEDEGSRPGCGFTGCLLWFLGGITLSVATISALALLVLLIISVSLNVYLGWQLSGMEITISRRTPGLPEQAGPSPTSALIMLETETPTAPETGTTTAVPAETLLQAQVGTVTALSTEAALGNIVPSSTSAPVPKVTATGTPAALEMAIPEKASPGDLSMPEPAGRAGSVPVGTPAAMPMEEAASAAASDNTYTLIPIEGDRDSRPAEEHGDLNLKLRDPQPIDVELSLVDAGVGVDPDAPKLSAILEPDFVAAYTVHDWDWGCNCKGELIEDPSVVLVGIETEPGEPIYIPPRNQDIYDGQYYAVVLYAAEDSLTLLYASGGTVVTGYSIHYLGLQTDPNLVALFRESEGKQLPGLTLDTPVGVATDELIVAIRDNGKFLDARSRNDWWD